MLTPDDLRAIAEELRCNAEALHDGHTVCGEWCDDDARREHDKLIRWADVMSALAEQHDLEMVDLRCLADIRAALGGGGQMMQSDLVEYIKALRKDAERYRWAAESEDNAYAFAGLVAVYSPSRDDIDGSIDAAMAKEA